MIIENCDQLSDEWFKLRLGNPGASNFSKIVTMKGEPSKQSKDYLYQLAAEAVSGQAEMSYQTPWMARGTELEGEARALYSLVNNCDVEQCGLIYFDQRRDRHCSPDGIIGGSGLELKVPMPKTHIKYLMGGKLPSDYFQQVQGSMYITGFDTWNFATYSPGLPLFQVTVERDEKFCNKLHEAMEAFVHELSVTIEKIRRMQ